MSETDNTVDIVPIKRPVRWHIFVFMLPALIVYSAVMVLPLIETLRLSLYNTVDGQPAFVGLANFKVLFGDPRWARDFWNALVNNLIFFAIHMCVQNPIGVALAALLSVPKLRGVAFTARRCSCRRSCPSSLSVSSGSSSFRRSGAWRPGCSILSG